MTGLEGINQDLDDILSDAGNPEFVGWLGNARLYKCKHRGLRVLITEESETQVLSYEWYDASALSVVDEPPNPHSVVEEEFDLKFSQIRLLVERYKAKKRGEDSPANILMRGLGYTSKTHPSLL